MNALVGFWEEYQADTTIAGLKSQLALGARMKRDGTWVSFHARELVPGDLIHLCLATNRRWSADSLPSRNWLASTCSARIKSVPSRRTSWRWVRYFACTRSPSAGPALGGPGLAKRRSGPIDMGILADLDKQQQDLARRAIRSPISSRLIRSISTQKPRSWNRMERRSVWRKGLHK